MACTCPDWDKLPMYDMDGSYFEWPEPCDECKAAYEGELDQQAIWAKDGKCMNCGGDEPLYHGICETCMNEYCSKMAGVPG